MLKYIKPQGTPNLDQLEEALEGRELSIRDTLISIAATLGAESNWNADTRIDMITAIREELDLLLADVMPSVGDPDSGEHWRAIATELDARAAQS